jgi:hypothetical protein
MVGSCFILQAYMGNRKASRMLFHLVLSMTFLSAGSMTLLLWHLMKYDKPTAVCVLTEYYSTAWQLTLSQLLRRNTAAGQQEVLVSDKLPLLFY